MTRLTVLIMWIAGVCGWTLAAAVSPTIEATAPGVTIVSVVLVLDAWWWTRGR